MITVATVLKTGGEFRSEHVNSIKHQVARHLTLKHRFVCLTDAAGLDVETLPLLHSWPGWWAKLALFDGRLTGPVVYFDLDTAIVGNIDDMVRGHWFTVLANFWGNGIGSGLMAWSGNLTGIYERFAERADEVMGTYTTRDKWGDQAFILDTVPATILDYWQLRHPGRVVSYRKDVEPTGRVPERASIICFGGQRRPWNTSLWKAGGHG